MNQGEKERDLPEYSIQKNQGKPFFPYAVAKDSAMAVVVMIVIIVMSIVLGAELGPKADATTTTYVPRPEWYFFFLFEVLRVIKPPYLVPLATIGIPTIAMVLLFLLPFSVRGPTPPPDPRPIAMTAMSLTIVVMAYLTYKGANAGPPTNVEMQVPPQYEAGKLVVAQSACLACHKIGDSGNGTLAPDLTHIGSRIPRAAILRSLEAGPSIMPSFTSLGRKKLNGLGDFLGYLK